MTVLPNGVQIVDGSKPSGLLGLAYGSSVDEVIGQLKADTQIRSFRWANSAEREAQEGMSPGDLGFQVDTHTTYQYSEGDWGILLEDTGWIDVDDLQNMTIISGSTISYRRKNGVVYFRGRGTFTGTASTTLYFTVPPGFRPEGQDNLFPTDTGAGRINFRGVSNPNPGQVIAAGTVSGNCSFFNVSYIAAPE